MAKKFFTDESLSTLVNETKSYVNSAVSTKAESSHTHDSSDIVSGTLSSDILPTVPVEKGGTGYTTIEDNTYTTARYRASSLNSTETTPTVNGVIAWYYE